MEALGALSHLSVEGDLSRRAERDCDVQVEFSIAFEPVDANVAHGGFEASLEALQARREIRLYKNAPETWGKRTNASEVCIEDVVDGCIHRMVV